MRSFGEYPKEENVSLLSQILEETAPQKYYLSERATKGILRRNEIKGGVPEVLEKALKGEEFAEGTTLTEKRFFKWYEDDTSVTLRRRSASYGGGSEVLVIEKDGVRRLTPTECERLQGFPDGWTDIGEWIDSEGKSHKAADTPRYEALGNSIALPFWKWVLARIPGETMGSLFDGIGGFPLAWGRTTKWVSEIEEFPVAVVSERFETE